MRKGYLLLEIFIVIVIIVLLAAVLFPIFLSARGKQRQTICMQHMREITTNLIIYTQSNRQTMMDDPGRASWSSKLTAVKDQSIFDCPSNSAAGNAAAPDYGLNAALFGVPVSKISGPGFCPLIADLGVAPAANYAIYDWERDLRMAHSGGTNVGFLDGHVSYVSFNGVEDKRLVTLMRRGINPFVISQSPVISLPAGVLDSLPLKRKTLTTKLADAGGKPIGSTDNLLITGKFLASDSISNLGLFVGSAPTTSAKSNFGVLLDIQSNRFIAGIGKMPLVPSLASSDRIDPPLTKNKWYTIKAYIVDGLVYGELLSDNKRIAMIPGVGQTPRDATLFRGALYLSISASSSLSPGRLSFNDVNIYKLPRRP